MLNGELHIQQLWGRQDSGVPPTRMGECGPRRGQSTRRGVTPDGP